jgi:hypothetical protein
MPKKRKNRKSQSKGIFSLFDNIGKTFNNAIGKTTKGIKKIPNRTLKTTSNIVNRTVKGVKKLPKGIIGTTSKITKGAIKGVERLPGRVVNRSSKLVNNTVKGVKNLPKGVINRSKSVLKRSATGLKRLPKKTINTSMAVLNRTVQGVERRLPIKSKKKKKKSKPKSGGGMNYPVNIKSSVPPTEQWDCPSSRVPEPKPNGGVYTGPSAYGGWGNINTPPTTDYMINKNLNSASPPPGANVQYPGTNRLGNNYTAMDGVKWFNDTSSTNPGPFRIKGTTA